MSRDSSGLNRCKKRSTASTQICFCWNHRETTSHKRSKGFKMSDLTDDSVSSQCDQCLYNTRNPHLPCTVHPHKTDAQCPDFELDASLPVGEWWEPEGASYYAGELVISPIQRWTREQKLALLDWHPMFTGRFLSVREHWCRLILRGCVGIVSAGGGMIRFRGCHQLVLEAELRNLYHLSYQSCRACESSFFHLQTFDQQR
jgi:hypothetical protein